MADDSEVSFVSKRSQVKNALRDDILQGRYELGAKIESERLLIKRFNVSRIIIRQALSDLESERLIMRQQGRGTFVSSPLHGRKDTSSKLIGVMVPDTLYMYDRTIRGVASVAVSNAYSVATSCFNVDRDVLDDAKTFVQNGINGILMVSRSAKSKAVYEVFQRHEMPVVFIDKELEGVTEDCVTPDNHQGLSIATQHLIDLGHRRIAYITHNPSKCACAPGLHERLSGFADTMKLNGLQANPDWVFALEEGEIGNRLEDILRAADRPTAFVTYNDAWAIRVVLACHKAGLTVPQDVSVVGFDNSDLPSQYDISLTSVEPEHQEMGIIAAEMLLDRINISQARPKRRVLIAPRLVLRDSTCKVKRP